jgi:primosomal protein N' (replication factor Y) (superfamily II helicase)
VVECPGDVLSARAKKTGPAARQLWLVPSASETGRHQVADVAVAAPVFDLVTYAVPDALREHVHLGSRVYVPLGRSDRQVEGLCLRLGEREWKHTRKPLLDAQPGPTWLSAALVDLGLWVSDYYVCPPWKTFAALVPKSLRAVRPRWRAYLRATGQAPVRRLSAPAAALLAALGDAERPRDEVLREIGASRVTLATLVRNDLVEVLQREAPPESLRDQSDLSVGSPEDAYALTPGQAAALAAIESRIKPEPQFEVSLLFGVPGSGKTEVYVRAIRQVIGLGRQAILLIPEIALTTQIVDRLARRFGGVAVLHSQLPERRRTETLHAIAAGHVDVVIGTRTAVFAPCPQLGLIVVDEEQEGSFKNLAAPFYHARDVAIKRGQLENIPVVLGSATPALETWHNAHHRDHYRLLCLSERVPGAVPPRTQLAPLPRVREDPSARVLAPLLRQALLAVLNAGEQAIVLHNRRGYAQFLRCASCGLLVSCERCGAHLISHQEAGAEILKCHRCGARRAAPARCLDSTCNGLLEHTGSAIQRLEQELRETLSNVRLLRLDSDTMRRRDDYRAALAAFERGEADIMIGTQMVAKGLDFPRVRLVGVIDADAALSLPDFRASERVFQLVVQVVGRAGRKEGASLAMVQAAEPVAPVLRHALAGEYEPFAAGELHMREQLHYPPFTRLVRLLCMDSRPERARDEAARLTEALRTMAGRISAALRIDDPEPCVVRRLRDMLRYQVLVRGPRGPEVGRLLHDAVRDSTLRPRVQRLTIDVDPLDLL